MPKFLAYGTLRKGSYNYERYKKLFGDEYNYIKTVTLPVPYVMVDTTGGAYPYLYSKSDIIIPEIGKDQNIVFDLIECSKKVWDWVTEMETNAGYKLATENKMQFFVARNRMNIGERHIIKSGDWIKYEKEVLKA